MNWHVEVIHLELVSHFTERLQRVLLLGLSETVRLFRLATLLRRTRQHLIITQHSSNNVHVEYRALTFATHLGHRQSPFGMVSSGGMRQ